MRQDPKERTVEPKREPLTQRSLNLIYQRAREFILQNKSIFNNNKNKKTRNDVGRAVQIVTLNTLKLKLIIAYWT